MDCGDNSINKCVVLCKGCGKLKMDKIAGKINCENIVILEDCESGLRLEKDYDFIVFGCPALFHLSDSKGFSEIVDIQLIEKCFKKPEEVAAAWINSALIFDILEFDAVETGYDVIYYGKNLDVISELSEQTNLCVITTEDVTEKLYPFRIKVIEIKEGSKISVNGKPGNFQVKVEGRDVIRNRTGEFTLTAGQIILPADFAESSAGIYAYEDEYKSAFKVLSNLGGYTEIKPVKVDYDTCGTYKSGFSGCELCFSCPKNAIKRENGKIRISDTCNGCGFCSAICPVSALESNILNSRTLMKKIDSVVEEGRTIAFICENSLSKLYRLSKRIKKKFPPALPIIVPCINFVSDVHYLYAALKGANVVVISCSSKHDYTNFEVAEGLLRAYGFDCLKIVSLEDFDRLKYKNPGRIIHGIESGNKREQLLHLIEELGNFQAIKSRIETELFGLVEVNGNCTLCMTCTFFCPANAIKNEEGVLYFNHGLCFACGLCIKACPENAITLKKFLDLEKIGEREIYRDEILKCPSCGKPHITKSMYEKLKTAGQYSILFCSDCRPRVILEKIYDEMMKEEGKKREG